MTHERVDSHNHLDHYFTSAVIVLPTIPYAPTLRTFQQCDPEKLSPPHLFNNCEDTILLQLDLAELMMQTAKEEFVYFRYIPNEEVTSVEKHKVNAAA